jgi:hypothetical protein
MHRPIFFRAGFGGIMYQDLRISENSRTNDRRGKALGKLSSCKRREIL